MSSRRGYLLILGDREAVAWVLNEQRMAFSQNRAAIARELTIGDELLLYTTRGAFHNPTRDRGRVVGQAIITSSIETLPRAVRVAGREFQLGCALSIESLTPLGQGVELAPLVSELRVFPQPNAWSAYMRRPVLQLPDADWLLLARRLKRLAGPPGEVIDEYIKAARGHTPGAGLASPRL